MSIVVSPATATLDGGLDSVKFSAVVNGGSGDQTVAWSSGDADVVIDPVTGVATPVEDTVSPVVITATQEGGIDTFTLHTAGTGYVKGQSVTVAGGDAGFPASLHIDSVSGPVTTAAVNNGGSGYAPADTVKISGGDGNAELTVGTVLNGKIVTSSLGSSGGSGYSASDAFTIAGGTGGAGAVDTVLSGIISAFHVSGINTGSGYAAGDTGSVTGGGGTGGTYTITEVDGGVPAGPGAVTGISILAGGHGYSISSSDTTAVGGSQPGSGDGALKVTITAVINGQVDTFHITAGGSGYSTGTDAATVSSPGSGLLVNIDTVKDGIVTAFSGFVAHGDTYVDATNVATTKTGGSGDNVLTVDIGVNAGALVHLTVVGAGSGYAAPTSNVALSGGSGSLGTIDIATVLASSTGTASVVVIGHMMSLDAPSFQRVQSYLSQRVQDLVGAALAPAELDRARKALAEIQQGPSGLVSTRVADLILSLMAQRVQDLRGAALQPAELDKVNTALAELQQAV
jgi:hypothetical protein